MAWQSASSSGARASPKRTMPARSPSARSSAWPSAMRDVLDGVVLVHPQVAGAGQAEVDQRVEGERGQHVVEEADAGRDRLRPSPSSGHSAVDLRLRRAPLDAPGAGAGRRRPARPAPRAPSASSSEVVVVRRALTRDPQAVRQRRRRCEPRCPCAPAAASGAAPARPGRQNRKLVHDGGTPAEPRSAGRHAVRARPPSRPPRAHLVGMLQRHLGQRRRDEEMPAGQPDRVELGGQRGGREDVADPGPGQREGLGQRAHHDRVVALADERREVGAAELDVGLIDHHAVRRTADSAASPARPRRWDCGDCTPTSAWRRRARRRGAAGQPHGHVVHRSTAAGAKAPVARAQRQLRRTGTAPRRRPRWG